MLSVSGNIKDAEPIFFKHQQLVEHLKTYAGDSFRKMVQCTFTYKILVLTNNPLDPFEVSEIINPDSALKVQINIWNDAFQLPWLPLIYNSTNDPSYKNFTNTKYDHLLPYKSYTIAFDTFGFGQMEEAQQFIKTIPTLGNSYASYVANFCYGKKYQKKYKPVDEGLQQRITGFTRGYIFPDFDEELNHRPDTVQIWHPFKTEHFEG